MNFFTKLNAAIHRNRSLLCVGLDPNPDHIPQRYRHPNDPIAAIFAWNQAIIQETSHLVCAYKPNIAFYEALGEPGMALLRRTLALIPSMLFLSSGFFSTSRIMPPMRRTSSSPMPRLVMVGVPMRIPLGRRGGAGS